MSADEPGPLPRGLLDRLPGSPAADLAVLRDGGYLRLALPPRFGGAGLDLAGLACAQRQLAARAPGTARALNHHHALVGAAADALASGHSGPEWVLADAARGRLFTGFGAEPRHGDVLVAGWYAWSLALDGMTSYAIARQAFDQAVERAHREEGPGRLDQWPVAEAALRLDDMRGRLDEAIEGWRRRVAAGGGLTSLDPGRLALIRQFTARHVAADGLHRVVELAGLIGTVPAGRA
jgi:alkylation response protein AidB-like acyl-CoA dehydrogenase